MDIEKIISEMSLGDKIAQLTQIYVLVKDIDKIEERLKKEPLGSLILATNATAGNTKQDSVSADILDRLQKICMENHGIPMMFGRDVIHGHGTYLPIPLALSASFDPDLIKEGYSRIAKEAKNDGINWSFAPMLDVSRDPRWGRIIESPGEDPYLGGKVAEAIVAGFQGDGDRINVAACAKHFVGYGASEGGRDYHRAESSDYSLRNFYLRAVDAAIKAGCATVVNSFNEVSGQAVASSKYLLTDVLRGELGFDGFVISDWDAIVQLIRQGRAEDKADAAALALCAGIDMDMADNCFYDNLEELVNSGRVPECVVDTAVRRILGIKEKMGLFENPYSARLDYDIDEHKAYARRLAADCMVLLKNENKALPLNKECTICVTGEMANDRRAIGGSWSLDFNENESVTIFEGIKNTCSNAFYYDADSCRDVVMKKADCTVVVIGESDKLTGEANSIAMIELTEKQRELIKRARAMSKRVVGVFAFGRPRAFADEEHLFDAILYAWHGGSETGNAVADILFGNQSPCGRLPVSMPRCTGQIPLFYNCPPSGRDVDGYYLDLTAYPNYWDVSGTPLYPFGYGLSYTEFKYSQVECAEYELSLEEIKNGKCFDVSVEVENVGDFDSKEVVQCYVRDCVSTMTRPIKELKAFEKVYIKKGDRRKITFSLGYDELGFYNNDGKFTVECGEFIVYVGKDCITENKIIIKVKE